MRINGILDYLKFRAKSTCSEERFGGKKAGLKNNSKCWALAAIWMEMLLIEMGKTVRQSKLWWMNQGFNFGCVKIEMPIKLNFKNC